MVIQTGEPIERKAWTDRRSIAAFPVDDHDRLSARLGHYSGVQSQNSEDTVTWSVFGSAMVHDWLPSVLEDAFPGRDLPRRWKLDFWQRRPHPDTGNRKHGPESDLTLTAEGWCIEVEAKWGSDIGGEQGQAKDRSQLEMRAITARRQAASPAQALVLVIAPGAERYGRHVRAGEFGKYFGADYRSTPAALGLGAAVVTWEQIAARIEQVDAGAAPARYLQWRLGMLTSSVREHLALAGV